MESLSKLECAVLRLKSQKDDHESIATQLKISSSSVIKHAANACKKLGTKKLSGAIAIAIDRGIIPAPPVPLRHISLTAQEKEVGKLITEGMTNPEIAREINKPLPTVKKTIETLLRKTDCSNRRELAAVLTTSNLLS